MNAHHPGNLNNCIDYVKVCIKLWYISVLRTSMLQLADILLHTLKQVSRQV